MPEVDRKGRGKFSSAAILLGHIVGSDEILRHAAILLHQAQQRVSLMGGSQELAALESDLHGALARDVAVRIVSLGMPPAVRGQVAPYLGENVSAPTRFLILVADQAHVLTATFPARERATAVFTDNPMLARLFSAFLNTEYYLVRLSNQNPALARELLSQVLEPEDRERYAHILDFLEQQTAEQIRD